MIGSSTFAYEQADTGNLAGVVNKKISSAMKMAAEERKFNDDKIKALADKKDKSKEEEEELKKLVGERSSRKKGSLFRKALGHEFGGDMFRRTKGAIKSLAGRDVSDAEDPTISKRQRFSNLIRNAGISVTPPKPEPNKEVDKVEQKSLFDTEPYTRKEKGTPVKDEGLGKVLTKVFDDVKSSYDNLSASIKGLGGSEKAQVKKSEGEVKALASIGGFLQSLKTVFDKQNETKQLEIKVEKDTLEFEIESAEKIEDVRREKEFEQDKDLSKSFDYSTGKGKEEEKKKKEKNIIERIFESVDTFRSKRSAKKRGRRSRSFGLGRGIKPSRPSMRSGRTQYTNPIGPQPINSSTPWAAKGIGDRGGIFGHSGFTPRLESSPIKMASGGIVNRNSFKNPVKKMAAGGVVDNPTVLPTDQMGPTAVLPARKLQQGLEAPGMVNKATPGKGMAEPLGEALKLPTIAAGGLLLTTMVESLKNLGFIGKAFAPVLKSMFSPLAAVFGLPVGLISAVIGSPASAATLGNIMLGRETESGGSLGGGTFGPSTSPGGGGGGGGSLQQGPSMTASGGSTASGYITSGFGARNTGIAGASTNHRGIDIAGGPWKEGAPISVIKPGVVEETGNLGSTGWGKYVVVKHDDGTYTLYGHLSQINVKKGDKIEDKAGAAKVIGKVGSTGVSSGPHLHFELGTGWNGTITGAVDPSSSVDNYIRGGGQVTIDAPTVAAAAPAPAASPTLQTPGALPQSGLNVQTVGLTLPSGGLNNIERTSTASSTVAPWAVASPFNLGYQTSW